MRNDPLAAAVIGILLAQGWHPPAPPFADQLDDAYAWALLSAQRPPVLVASQAEGYDPHADIPFDGTGYLDA